MSRTFTLDEAQSLLPVLESLLLRAQKQGRICAEIEVELEQVRQQIALAGGMHLDVARVARRRAERDKALQDTKDALAEIEAIGVQVKDLEQGLLDFPCIIDGKTVLLCWKQGEKEIAFWHSIEEGFAGRKPIDARFSKPQRDRPN
ncbi:DUF2203 domain-containing protein [Edaphobacter flagellatus]|uniref:DUF2203 domain-containing protein n=1 Tax=Edaphobacter flagellatus TaxID=1933044 RepID=UPI0021B38752|nr:DUF2203 domain-containing protein [Edaphobacter flagellatus]